MNTIKILFVLDKAKVNKLGFAPLRFRITYLRERKPFATGASAFLAVVSCKKTEVQATDVNADSTAAAAVVDNDSLPIISNPTVNSWDGAAEKGMDNATAAVK